MTTDVQLEDNTQDVSADDKVSRAELKKVIAKRDEVKQKLRDSEAEKEQLQAKLNELEDEKATIKQDYGKRLGAFKKSVLERDIMDAASRNSAINPSQISKLLSHDFEYDEESHTWNRPVFENGELTGKQSVDKYVSNFLSSDANSNLVHGGLKRGSGISTHQTGYSPQPTKSNGALNWKGVPSGAKNKIKQWAKDRDMDLKSGIDLYRKHGDTMFR